jgi:hypothetical protein
MGFVPQPNLRLLYSVLNNDAINLARGIHYDFLSRVPKEIQDIIEQHPFNPENDPISAILSAPLLAQNDIDLPFAILNTTVGHSGISEDGIFQVASSHIGSQKTGIPQTSFPEVSSTEITSLESSFQKFGSTKVSSTEVSLSQSSLKQISSTEIGFTEVGSIKTALDQQGSTKIDFPQISQAQILIGQINPTEISFPGSITLQQFLTGHNFNLQNTTVPTWLESLQGTTPFNLNIEIKDLPTG